MRGLWAAAIAIAGCGEETKPGPRDESLAATAFEAEGTICWKIAAHDCVRQ